MNNFPTMHIQIRKDQRDKQQVFKSDAVKIKRKKAFACALQYTKTTKADVEHQNITIIMQSETKQDTESLPHGFQIKYRVGDCAYGKAIFAEEDVKKGTLVHIQRIGVDIKLIGGEKELLVELEKLKTDAERKDYLEHTLAYGETVYVGVTDEQYINHSSEPNIRVFDSQAGTEADPNTILDYAIRDISKGDMIVEDYSKVYDHPEWLMKIITKYGVDPEFY